MKKLLKLVFLALGFLCVPLFLISCSEDVDNRPVYANPLVPRRTDPCVYKHTNGYYYLTYSYDYGGYTEIRMRRVNQISALHYANQKDSYSTGEETVIPQAKLASWGIKPYIWAPELKYYNGTWYLFFTGSEDSNNWHQRPYVAKSDSLDPIGGDWEFVGKIGASVDIDYSAGDNIINKYTMGPFAFEEDGQWYFMWTMTIEDGDADWDLDGEKNGFLKIQTVKNGVQSSETFESLAVEDKWQCIFIGKTSPEDFSKVTDATIISVPQYIWECGEDSSYNHSDLKYGNTNDAPAIIKHDGKLMCVFSAGDLDESNCLGLLTATDKSNLCNYYSWKKKSTPLLKTGDDNFIFGPGSASFTRDENDRYDVIVFHARGYPGLNPTKDNLVNATDSYEDKNHGIYAKAFLWNDDGTPDLRN